MDFRTWLLEQVGRVDPCGRLARDVASEEKRQHRQLTFINELTALRVYRTYMPRATMLSKEEVATVWAEWVSVERELTP